ncbi:MAG: NAD-dependent epimerase/dehydratase family protein [Desulfobulbaceae bacterium]|nr:NAD-dependent epimerase/dehydratase family protein [Desulfobulbaceae bacterium]
MKRILITGAMGQVGAELTAALRQRFGRENVVTSDVKEVSKDHLDAIAPYTPLDVRDFSGLTHIIKKHKIDTIFHLAAILSATGEKKPQLTWDININGLYTILEAAREYKCAVFHPSSIAAFGPDTPRDNTPQDTIQRPNTIYGITKVSGELLCDYYFRKYGVDTRGLRFPGLISYTAKPGGGTTDYAVEIFYSAVQEKKYTCFLKAETALDMLYMPDAVRASIELMEISPAKLKHRNAFNITSMNVTPKALATEIKKVLPDFTMQYRIDPTRQAIADSWPKHLNDSQARKEWRWQPEYDLATMTRDMIEKLTAKLRRPPDAACTT